MYKLYLSILLSFIFITHVHADYPFAGNRQLMIEKDNTELGNLKYSHLYACLKNASFPNDPGPRKLITNIPRLVMTTIDNTDWSIQIRENEKTVIIEGIELNTTHYYLLKDKRRLLLRLFGHCDLDEFIETKD